MWYTDERVEFRVDADLRRKQRREWADLVVERAGSLDPADAAVLRAVYGDGRPIKELAAMVGVPPRAMSRRVHRLVRRVMSPPFEFVVRFAHNWTRERRRVAFSIVVLGRPLRQTAADVGLSLYEVRRHYAAVMALVEAATALSRKQTAQPAADTDEPD